MHVRLEYAWSLVKETMLGNLRFQVLLQKYRHNLLKLVTSPISGDFLNSCRSSFKRPEIVVHFLALNHHRDLNTKRTQIDCRA